MSIFYTLSYKLSDSTRGVWREGSRGIFSNVMGKRIKWDWKWTPVSWVTGRVRSELEPVGNFQKKFLCKSVHSFYGEDFDRHSGEEVLACFGCYKENQEKSLTWTLKNVLFSQHCLKLELLWTYKDLSGAYFFIFRFEFRCHKRRFLE